MAEDTRGSLGHSRKGPDSWQDADGRRLGAEEASRQKSGGALNASAAAGLTSQSARGAGAHGHGASKPVRGAAESLAMTKPVPAVPASVADALRLARQTLLSAKEDGADVSEQRSQADPSEIEHTARIEAEWLLQWASGWNRTALLMSFHDPMGDEMWSRFWSAVERRAAGEPLQYIVGEAAFYGRTFHVEPGCLIPRPETEHLAEAAITYIHSEFRAGEFASSEFGTDEFVSKESGLAGSVSSEFVSNDSGLAESGPNDIASREQGLGRPRVVDIGTGSGALAVSIALECPTAEVWAVDLSEDALRIAHGNAETLGADVTFVHEDGVEWLAGRRESAVGRLNVIVSNPPYIPSADIEGLDTDVREHEPRLALDGGEDGLDFYRRLAGLGQSIFANGPAAIFLEVGAGQAPDVRDLFLTPGADFDGWRFELIKDLRGIERIVKGVRDKSEIAR